MLPTTRNTVEQERAIEAARAVLEADPRFAGCWVEGSFGSGTADAWSDIDLHAAVPDEFFEAAVADRHALLGRILPVLGYGEESFPSGTRLVYALLAGGVRFDLYIERLGAVEDIPRAAPPWLLFDRGDVAPRLRVVDDHPAAIGPWLERLLRAYLFGATWPVRLWGRREWGTLQMNALEIVFQFLVPLMLAQDDPANHYRPRYRNERRLPAGRRAEVDALTRDVAVAFSRPEDGVPDEQRIRRLYEQLIGRILGEFRAACALYGVPYPEAAEDDLRAYYRRELSIDPAPRPSSG